MTPQIPENKIRYYSERYQPSADENVLMAQNELVQQAGFVTRDQLKALARWKSARSAGHVEKNSEEFVREITGFALNAKCERARIESLTVLNGVQWPTASALLHLFHKDDYPLLDTRASWSMGLDTQIKQYDFDSWWLYVEACRKMAHLNNFTMRELDRALWQYSKEHQPPEKSTVKKRVKRTTKTQTPTRLVP